MRTVVPALVGVALIAVAFGVGRVTRADAGGAPVVAPAPTPVTLAPTAPVSATSVSAGKSIPALRPAPTPKPKKKQQRAAPTAPTTTVATPAATTAPSTSQPSTPNTSSPPPAKKMQPSSKPVEEIG